MERLLVGHAVALLSIELAKPARVIDAEQRLRVGVTLALLQNSLEVDESLLQFLGFAPDSSIAVAVFTGVGPLLPATQHLTAALEDESVPYLMSNLRNGEGIAVGVGAEVARELADRLYTRVRSRLRRSINGGIGGPAIITGANLSLQQALSAVRVAEVSGHKLVSFSDLGTFSLLLSTQSDDFCGRSPPAGWELSTTTTGTTAPSWWCPLNHSCTTTGTGRQQRPSWEFTGTPCANGWTGWSS